MAVGTTPDPTLDPVIPDQNIEPNVDTPGNVPPAPPATSGHGEDPSLSQDAKVQAALREYGKLQQVQKELEEAKEKASRYENIEQVAMQSPEKYKRALVEFNGVDEYAAEAEVQRLRQAGYWQQAAPQVQQQPNAPVYDPAVIAEQVAQTYKAEAQKHELQRRVFEALPEIAPSNVTGDRRSMVEALTLAVEVEATRRMRANKTDFVNEFVTVYKEITGKTDDQLKQAQEQGRMQGIMENSAASFAAGAPTKSAAPQGESNYGLTSEEVAQAKAEGLSLQDFAELKDPKTVVKTRS